MSDTLSWGCTIRGPCRPSVTGRGTDAEHKGRGIRHAVMEAVDERPCRRAGLQICRNGGSQREGHEKPRVPNVSQT